MNWGVELSPEEGLKQQRKRDLLLMRKYIFKNAVVILLIEFLAYLFLRLNIKNPLVFCSIISCLIMLGMFSVGCWTFWLFAYIWEKQEDHIEK